MDLTDQEWDDLAAMLRPHVLNVHQRQWAVAWEHKVPRWRTARRRSDLAERIIAGRVTEATAPSRAPSAEIAAEGQEDQQ